MSPSVNSQSLRSSKEPPLDEAANLVVGYTGILFDLVQDLESDLTASGSSRHDQVASPLGHMAIRLLIIRQNRPIEKGTSCLLWSSAAWRPQ